MPVLLVHLPVGFEESYPLALAALAAPLLARGHAVEGLDVGRVGLDGLARRLARGDVHVVGLGVWSPAAPQARDVAALVRRAPGRPLLVTGGPHATLMPEDVPADAVVLGEGELTFADLVDAAAAGRAFAGIPGVATPGHAGLHRAAARPPADLGDLPLPDRTVFSIHDYHRDHLPRGRRYASVVTSRGCRYRCAYCSAPALWGRGHRFRPPRQVWEEWRRLRVDNGVDGVLVEDDLFTQDRRRVAALCEVLVASPPGVTWELLNGVRPETLDASLLALMARAGLTRLALSLETADREQLKRMGRSPNLERVADVVRAARESGIGVTGYFLVGLPGERRADREATFAFAEGLQLDMAHFSVASAWPGTTWSHADLTHVPPTERASYYGRWYLHPRRALRAAKMLGVRPREVLGMAGRLARWMTSPLEERRVVL